jgi:hypothetical protein
MSYVCRMVHPRRFQTDKGGTTDGSLMQRLVKDTVHQKVDTGDTIQRQQR